MSPWSMRSAEPWLQLTNKFMDMQLFLWSCSFCLGPVLSWYPFASAIGMPMDPHNTFCYVVDDKGYMRELEVKNGLVEDQETWELYADSQVGSGWMAAAYRCLKDDPCDVIVVDDPHETSTTSACLDASVPDSHPDALGNCLEIHEVVSSTPLPSASTSCGRKRSRSRPSSSGKSEKK